MDVGANSVHLLVAQVDDHRLEPLDDESVFLGLGSAVDSTGELGTPLRAELAAALARYAAAARDLEAADTLLIGTEPLRRAADSAVTAEACERASGLPLHTVTHEEEGLLTAVGVTSGRPVAAPLLIVDVGGGSTEFVLVDPAAGPRAWAVPLGSARLTERVAVGDPPLPRDLEELRRHAREGLARSPIFQASEIVAVGGTASNLAKVAPGAAVAGVLTRDGLAEALAALATQPAAAFAARHALNPRRAPILAAGAAILEAILERYGHVHLRVSEAGIREGAILARARAGAAWRERLPELAAGWRDPRDDG